MSKIVNGGNILLCHFSIVLEIFSFRTAIIETNKVRGKRSFAKFVKDSRQPELPVILLEDFGALIGLVFALVGVSAAVITGDGRWDGMGAMAIGSLLIVIAVILVREMSGMLVGEGALPEEYEAVQAALESAPLVERVIHLRTLHCLAILRLQVHACFHYVGILCKRHHFQKPTPQRKQVLLFELIFASQASIGHQYRISVASHLQRWRSSFKRYSSLIECCLYSC